MKKHQFKPFDKVLVRDYDDDPWRAIHYSHFDDAQQRHYCGNSYWNQCIPYNENTAHFLGTCEPYKEPEPKIWQISSMGYNEVMTSEELENFIKDVVIKNKDITNFQIRYINNN